MDNTRCQLSFYAFKCKMRQLTSQLLTREFCTSVLFNYGFLLHVLFLIQDPVMFLNRLVQRSKAIFSFDSGGVFNASEANKLCSITCVLEHTNDHVPWPPCCVLQGLRGKAKIMYSFHINEKKKDSSKTFISQHWHHRNVQGFIMIHSQADDIGSWAFSISFFPFIPKPDKPIWCQKKVVQRKLSFELL